MTQAQENAILALIGTEPDGLLPIEVQKLMFIISHESGTGFYDFIPFSKGCYSPSLNDDMWKLKSRGLLRIIENDVTHRKWGLTEEGRIRVLARRDVACRFAQFRRNYKLKGNDLVADVYRRYPYYAINSRIVNDILGDDVSAVAAINEAKPKNRVPLASIGYEKRTFEDYLKALINNRISVLCDVRRNPISRKYGFSKGTLISACVSLGIEYRHYQTLGIPSCERQELHTQKDYDELFAWYEKRVLTSENAQESLDEISRLVANGDAVAVTCFEANPAQCHRTRVLSAVSARCGVEAELI